MARRWKKVVGISLLTIVALLAAAITFTVGWRPVIGPKARALTDRQFEPAPERLARGRYLVEGVMGCFDCHSERNLEAPGGPIIDAKRGAGRVFLEGGDFPGRLVASNITPDKETGVGNWSDDMLARAIREGIGRDGRALFPAMPYGSYRSLSDEDLASVIVYLRSIPPVRNRPPETEISFPVNRLINNAPEPVYSPVPQPDLSDPAKRGDYLTRMGGCADCHTPQENGRPKAGFDFAGGNIIERVAAANITTDPSGIPYYDEALFVGVMRTGNVKARPLSPVMPWIVYRNMSDEDLKAMFAYLRTLAPVKHNVDNAATPTDCKLCRNKHGGGDLN